MPTTELRAQTANSAKEEIRLQGKLAMPIVATYLAELMMWYVDHAIVGRLGATELGAVGLSGLLFWELIIIGVAILSVVGVIVGNAHGAGDVEMVGRGVRQGLWISVFLSAPLMLISRFLMDMLVWTGQDPAIITLGQDYIRAAVWVIPPSLAFVALRSFVVGVSRPLVVTALALMTLPVNLALSYVLVFGWGAIPALGVAGAGWATSIVGWLSFIALLVYVQRHHVLRRYQVLRDLLSFDPQLWRRIWRLGLPVSGIALVEGSTFQVMTVLVGVFGALTLAAHQIVINAISLGFMIAMGIADAAAVRVSQEMGAGRAAAARRAGWIANTAGMIIGVVSAIFLCATPEWVAGVFLNIDDPRNKDVLEITRTLALIGAVMAVVDMSLIVASRCLRGLEDTVMPMMISGVGSWLVAFPLGAILAFGFDLGPAGLWWGLTGGVAATSGLMLWRWRLISNSRLVT